MAATSTGVQARRVRARAGQRRAVTGLSTRSRVLCISTIIRFELLDFRRCLEYVQRTVALIHDVNPSCKILMTTSPMPMQRTFTEMDVIVANMQSKATLRAVCGEIYHSEDGVDYFPAFESVMLTKSWDIWERDKTYVRHSFVGKIVKHLVDAYFTEPNRARTLLQGSEISLRDGDLEKAEAEISQAVLLAPEESECRQQYALILLYRGNLAEAEVQQRKAAQLNPENPALSCQRLSLILFHQNKMEESLACALEAVNRAPDGLYYRHHYAQVLLKAGNLIEAELQQRRAVDGGPEVAEFHGQLGQILTARERFGEAAAAAFEAVRLDPDSAKHRCTYASALMRQRNLAEAEVQARKAISLAPQIATHQDLLGRILSLQDGI